MSQEEQEYKRRKDDGLELDGPLGWRVHARGPVVVSLLIAAIVVAAIIWALKGHDDHMSAQAAEEIKNLNLVAQRLDEVGYILTLSESQRKDLRMDMPESLRKKVSQR